MSDIIWENYWWENIAGASHTVSDVANHLALGQSIALFVPEDLPWRHSMRSAVESLFRKINSSDSVFFKTLDVNDEFDSESQISRFILKKYCRDEDTILGFREKGKKSIYEYIKKNGVLNNQIIWIKGIPKSDEAEWIDFCIQYNSSSLEAGLFVLELREKPHSIESSNIYSTVYSEYISKNDLQLFNSLQTNELQVNDKWKSYITSLVTELCVTDAELATELIACTNFKEEEPIDVLGRLSEDYPFYLRGKDADSDHILNLIRLSDTQAISHRIWKAQLQSLFPLIELERFSFIAEYEEQITSIIEQRSPEQYNEPLTNPYDAEWGTIVYWNKHQDINGHYWLYIPEEEKRTRIRLLHECRNNIAHASICTLPQIIELIDKPVF